MPCLDCFFVKISIYAMDPSEIDFSDMTRNEIIEYYYSLNYTHKEITSVLLSVHDIALSCRQIRRILRDRQCYRRKPTQSTYREAVIFVQKQLEESGKCLGYRALWKRLNTNGIHISQQKTLIILRHLDREGVDSRKRRRLRRREYVNPGPNFAWHMDGYDKLKPFGFPIHGAVDGFSRRVLWLNVGPTNNNPLLIAQYYMTTVRDLSCVPCVVRADRGNENVHVRKIQTYLRSQFNDCLAGENAFQYGKSTGNQRIESFWGHLRKQCVQFWMDKFKGLVATGHLDMSSRLEALTLRFCFLHLIRRDLNRMAHEWNIHRIRQQRADDQVVGKPDIMYFSPQTFGAANFRKEVQPREVEIIMDTLENAHDFDDYSIDFLQMLNQLMGNVQLPKSVGDATNLFCDIVRQIREEMA